LTKEEEEYYDAYFDMFHTTGWKQFIDEINDIINGFRIEDIKDEKHLSLVQGQLQMLTRTANFEDGLRNTYDDLTEDIDAS
jgi:hypothetical protein|tara:strand:- start:800 stop:1042 length:243 start_codon:yes stop_codon:yes gene_type:complete